jgi:hypothetical protein
LLEGGGRQRPDLTVQFFPNALIVLLDLERETIGRPSRKADESTAVPRKSRPLAPPLTAVNRSADLGKESRLGRLSFGW